MARTSLYQNGGAFGFRDQLQDAVNLLLLDSKPAREQIGRSGTAYHDRQTGFGFEGMDLNRTCCGLCAALQFLSCLFGGRGCPVILCC